MVAGCVVAAMLVLAGQASARPTVTLLPSFDLRLQGPDRVGTAGAGDVNGDGRTDTIVNQYNADNNGRTDSGSVYVIYGRPGAPNTSISLTDTNGAGTAGTGVDPADGFRVDGAAADDLTGAVAQGAGDVNGDGLDDVIVGTVSTNAPGKAYVIYGRATAPVAPVDLADTNGAGAAGTGVDSATGFRVDGAAGDEAGEKVAGAGDMNSDGIDDVVIGATGADNNGRSSSGSAYVLYGRSGLRAGPVDLADTNGAAAGVGVQPADGFRVDGYQQARVGESVAGAGDVNGDEFDDVLVGASTENGGATRGRPAAGGAYVIYGGAASPPGPLDLVDSNGAAAGDGIDPADGVRIMGPVDFSFSGFVVAGAGDVNGDGRGDVTVDARSRPANFNRYTYVVYGREGTPAGPVDLADTNGADPGDGVATRRPATGSMAPWRRIRRAWRPMGRAT